jgi:hypothetical protein
MVMTEQEYFAIKRIMESADGKLMSEYISKVIEANMKNIIASLMNSNDASIDYERLKAVKHRTLAYKTMLAAFNETLKKEAQK